MLKKTMKEIADAQRNNGKKLKKILSDGAIAKERLSSENNPYCNDEHAKQNTIAYLKKCRVMFR